MKRCPSCQAVYIDDSLEFCLEDGSRLVSTSTTTKPQPGITPSQYPAEPLSNVSTAMSEPTVVMNAAAPLRQHSRDLVSEPARDTFQWLEHLPIALALLHNWWQWVYLEKVYVYSWADYLLSANFLMWLLLFASGTGTGIYFLKRHGNKLPAIIALVALAVNLILFLVPRR